MADEVQLSDFSPQGAVYDGLIRSLREGSFVHAYLISGMAGVGKRTLADCMTRFLLCSGAEKPCGVCPGCVQVRRGDHPDVVAVRPGKLVNSDQPSGKSIIPVDDIREVVRICGEHTFEGGRRIVRIEQAEKMNPSAQNALLKTLEEPIEGNIFLLITDSPSLLLPTIVSRCRHLTLHAWPDKVVEHALTQSGAMPERRRDALRLCEGSIGKALALTSDDGFWERRNEIMRDFFALEERSAIIRVSGSWKDKRDKADELFSDVEDMVRTLMLVRLGRLGAEASAAYPAAWQRMAREAPLDAFVRLDEGVREARMMRANQVTWQAVVERLLFRLMEEKSKWSM